MAPALHWESHHGTGEGQPHYWVLLYNGEVTRSDSAKKLCKTHSRGDVRGGRLPAGCWGDKVLIQNLSSRQLQQAGSSRAHSCVSPSPATGKLCWFELLLMGMKSELILLTQCSWPSPYTQVGVAHHTFRLNDDLPKLGSLFGMG